MKYFLATLRNRNRPLYYFGGVCIAASMVCALLIFFTQTQVLGINAWIKPFKFFISSAIFGWTMGWIMEYLGEDKKVFIYSWMVIVVLAFETIYIALQAGQGLLSHFNVGDAFHGLMFSLMGIAISILAIWTGYIGYLFFVKHFPSLPPAYLWGLRLGILFFVVFAFEGGLMAARLAHTVGAPDAGPGLPLTNWSSSHGDLRVAHFMGMHALQVLPLMAFYIFRNLKTTILFAAIYFGVVTFLFLQALSGYPLLRM